VPADEAALPIPKGLRALTTGEAAKLRTAIKAIISGPSNEGLSRGEENEMKAVENDAKSYSP